MSASSSSKSKKDAVAWKHIGLRGHSVGTISFERDKIVWKSAIVTEDDQAANQGAFSRSIPASSLKGFQWTVLARSGYLRIQTKSSSSGSSKDGADKDKASSATSNVKHEYRFDGFPPNDYDLLSETLQQKYNLDLSNHPLSSSGTQYGFSTIQNKNLVFNHCVLDEMNEEGQEFEPRAEDEMMSLDLAEVSQCVLPGTNRNEIELQFPESDAVEAGTDQLVAIRMYIPPELDADPADKQAPTAAEKLQQKIMLTANIRKTTGDVLVSFDSANGTFLTPRGRYAIELYDYFLRMRGQKYDYKIKYDDINRLFLLPKPDEVHMAFVIALDKPIRQGQQRYQCLVLQASKEHDEIQVNLDDDVLAKEYDNELQPIMRGSLANLIAKTFKVIAKKKVFIPGKFANASQQACVKCAVRANEGLLYPLEKQFVFIHKPPILVRFNEIDSVEFQRYAGGQGSTRNFDLCVTLKDQSGGQRDYTFSGIDKADYQSLYNFLSSKKIRIKNLQETGAGFLEEPTRASKAVYNEDEIYGGPMEGEEEEESEDEDYDEAAAAKEEAEAADESDEDSDDDLDDDELGSEIDDELDSDLEEFRGKGKKKKKRKSEGDDDDDDEEEKTPKKKKAKKKKSDAGGGDSAAKKKRAKKDPNAPKRGITSYIMFSNAERGRIKEANPGATVGEIAKILGAEWKTLSPEKKAKYEAMAAKDKKRYEEEMKDYVPPKDAGGGGKGGKKAKAKKDPNAPKRAVTSFFYFSQEMRPKLKEESPDLSFGDLGRKIGEMFRNLTPEEKEKYEEMAKKDKVRYKREMDEYNAKQKSQAKKDDSNDDDDDSDDDDDDSEEDAKPAAAAKKGGKAKAKAAPDSDEDDSDEDDSDDSDDDDDEDDDDSE